ncbi:MAG: peptide deformylase [Bryobacteraceae bacterium]
MPTRRIRHLGDPVLRQVSAPVADPRRESSLLDDLRSTLHDFQRTRGFGRGISAVQIGEPKRLIYIEFEGAAYPLFNPRYSRQSGKTFELWDDCFSFPDLVVWVRRHESVSIRYQDELGVERELTGTDSFSELLQHEMDHLDGVLAIDHAVDANSLATRDEWLRRGAPGRRRWPEGERP